MLTPVHWTFTGRLPLARRILLANKPRLFRAVSGIGFAVLLMLMQLGFERAFYNSSLQVIDLLDGDIIIQSAHKYRFFTRDPFPPAELDRARQVPGVMSVQPFYASWFDFFWKNPLDGKTFPIRVFAFEPDGPVLRIPEVVAHAAALKELDTVLVDSKARRFLGMGEGTGASQAEINGRTVRIVGHFSLGPDFQSDGTVIMSSQTFARLLLPGAYQGMEAGVIKVRPGENPQVIAHTLTVALPSEIAVFTIEQLLQFERSFQAEVSSAGPIFAMGTVVGFVIGALISYVMIYTDLTEQLPQYATLIAMGYFPSYIVGVVLRQALLLAVGGWVSAWLFSLLLYRAITELAMIPLTTSFEIVFVSLALTLAMCVASAALAVIRVISLDPADVVF